ncbi:hypothetical protein LWI29_029433 [Acer saccharum]|uniref:Uncharacterized protein n=1 Tax=Acer saccharum TaxID=4024 RepID=A0AA39SDF0_ACESA|nr:hypothetical protein LWI29_029433 [Acer saccharum]
MDKLLKMAFVAAAINFPSALFGMFCIFTILMVLDSTIPDVATTLTNFFQPALLFIQRWLPLFYVPYIVVLPLSIRDIPPASGLKICFIIAGGWLASLCVAGYTAFAVRKMVNVEMIDAEPMAKPSPFVPIEVWLWSGVFLISFVTALLYPTALGTTARTFLPFLLASTVLGYMVGSWLPSGLKKVFHPIICCALSADLAALAFGYLSQSGFDPVLGNYLTKVSSNPGAGDVLMEFLGSVILSFAFSMFTQRKLVKRHAAEIFTSIIVSTLFSLYSTALIGRLVGLEPTLTVSILPRCITVALALSIVSLFEGTNPSLTAAVVVVTGLIGANFVQATLDKLKFRDPISRGIATASSAHGLGTAALSAKEPEALPFCAIAYALTANSVESHFFIDLTSLYIVKQSVVAIEMGTYSNQNPMIPEANTASSASHMAWFYHGNYFTSGTSLNPSSGLPVTPIRSIASTTESVNYVDPSGTKSSKVKRQKSSMKGGSNQVGSKVVKPKKASSSKKAKGQTLPETKREKRNPNIDMDGMNFDFSGVPSPVCSCTGTTRVCYKWGAGGWQSSCCTISVSEYPLPMSSTRPGVRLAGRKMSNGAYLKLLLRLASEDHDLSLPVDLKDHWARHGTNKFVTIK